MLGAQGIKRFASKEAAARHLGLKRFQIGTLVDRGAPHVLVKGRPKFDLLALSEWWNVNAIRLLTKAGTIRPRSEQPDDGLASFAGIIYAIVDASSGQAIYIGKATHLVERWRHHRQDLARGQHGNWRLQAWFDERGRSPAAIDIQIVEACDAESLNAREQFWIERERANGRLLNISDGGGCNRTHEPDVRAKLSEISKRKWADPDYRSRWAKAMGRDLHAAAERKAEQVRRRAEKAEAKRLASITPVRVPLTVKGSYAFLHLGPSLRALIDAEDWQRLHAYAWHVSRKRDLIRVKRSFGGARSELLGRAVMCASDAECVSQVGDPLDYRRESLQLRPRHSHRRRTAKLC